MSWTLWGRRAVPVATALALMTPAPTGAQPAESSAAAKTRVALSGPSSVTAGARASFTVRVTPTKRLARGAVQLYLSTDAKRDRRDRSLAKRTVRKLPARKAKRLAITVSVPRTTAARTYRVLACLTVGKATSCVSRRLIVRSAATTPAAPPPAPPSSANPTPQPSPALPKPVVINESGPAPGPNDAPAADPATKADALPTDSTTSHRSATSFLYTGPDPIQKDVAPGTITVKRSAVLRGRVLNRFGGGIGGVRVTVADHPELGRTATRADGGYDIAVNGGGALTLVFEREGFISGQRLVQVPYQDSVPVDTIVLVPYDQRATIIDTSGPDILEARGTTITDDAGTRSQTLLFEPGTAAEMVVGGQTQPIGSVFTVRSTEFTQGERGPEAMPGQLPPTTAYTYAAEFSIDAAVQAGATDVRFSKPVPTYVENFVGLPVGTAVPAGYYDRGREAWVGAPNGRVVKVVAGGIDTDGDGSADNNGIDDAERDKVLALYPSGAELWRVEITHFTPWDYNYPYGPAPGAESPGPQVGPAGPPPEPNPCPGQGSVLLCPQQVLGEDVPLVGTGAQLVYRSDRVPGRQTERVLQIRLADGPLDDTLDAVELAVTVAGRTTLNTFTRAQVLSTPVTTFTWDGKDAYGRTVEGSMPATVDITYNFRAVYQAPGNFAASWARFSGTPVTSPARGSFSFTKTGTAVLASHDARGVGLGGWTYADHHTYDPQSRTILRGDGGFATAEPLRLGALAQQSSSATLDGTSGITVAPDGALVVADTSNHRIRRIAADGTATTLAGTGAFGYRPGDDGGPATSARLSSPQAVAAFEDGAGQPVVVFADTSANRIRRIAPDGTITTIAGGGSALGDDGPATAARLSLPRGVAVAPDGTIYVADTGQHRVRMIGTDGRITTVAGTGSAGFSGDGGRAALAQLRGPQGLAVSPTGDLLIADTGNARIRAVSLDGTIATVAGGANAPDDVGDGLAPTAAELVEPTAVALRRSGALVIADPGAGRVREATVEGVMRTLAGGGTEPRVDGVPAVATALDGPTGVAVGADDVAAFTEPSEDQVSRVAPELPGFGAGDALIPSPDGAHVYQFNLDGRHLRTLDALTGAVLRRFTYDSEGRLAGVFDDAAGASPAHSALVTITRPTATSVVLTARGGAQTTMALDGEGWAASVTNPADELMDLDHGASGLLTGTEDPEGGSHTFTYDSQGRLESDTDPDGLVQTLTRTSVDGGHEVALSSPGGRTTTYRSIVDDLGQHVETITEPAGGATDITTNPDGTRTVAWPDGTVDVVRRSPDPRFGMQAPFTSFRRKTLPSGKSSTLTATKAITMRDATRLETSTETITLDGRTSTRVFDAAPGDDGGTLTTTTAAGRTNVGVFDNRARLVSSQAGNAVPLTTTYDDNDDGRVTEQARGARSWTYDYDARGRITTRTTGEGRATSYIYDDANRLLTSTTASQTAAQTYDDNGRRLSLTTPGGRQSAFTHTPGGRSDQLTLPGDQVVDRGYTSLMAQDRQALPTGAVVDTTFAPSTGQTRIASQTARNAAAGPAVSARAFTYIGANDLLDVGTWTAGALTQTLDTDTDGDVATKLTYGGEAAGEITFTPAASGLLLSTTSVTAGADPTRTYAITRDNDDLVTGYGPFTVTRNAQTGAAETFGQATDDTQVQTLDTEGFGDLDERRVVEAGDERYELETTYDDEGRLTQRTETVEGGAAITRKYAYDSQGRLDEVRDGTDAVVEDYAYDGNGDRTSALSEDHGAQAATYDATTGLQTAAGPLAFSFDADGFLAQRGGDDYDYAPSGELLSAEAGATTVTYAYDVVGRRTRRTAGGVDTSYLYGNPDWPWQVTATVDDAGALTTYFYDERGHLHALERGGQRYRVGADQVGTPRVVIDADGTVVKRVDRDTWGRMLADSAPAFSLPIGFAGGIEDPDTGLVRFGMRDYDPQTGRFTARDPLFHQGSPGNLFAYADSSPASRVDPSGMIAVGLSGYLGMGGGGQVSINWETGVGWCTEGGGGVSAGAEVDLWGNPSRGQSYITEAGGEVLGLGITLGAEEGLCPPKGNGQDQYSVKLSAPGLAYKKNITTNDYTVETGVGLKAGFKTGIKDCETWTWSDLAGYL